MQRATASQDRFVCLFIIVVLSPRTLQFSLNISLVQLLISHHMEFVTSYAMKTSAEICLI